MLSNPTPESVQDPLRTLFSRQRRDWQVTLFGAAAGLVVLGGALIWFEASPPLSTEERQLIGIGALMVLVGIGAIARAVMGTEPAFRAFTTADIVWVHFGLKGGRQFLRLGTTLGNTEQLRLDVAGTQLHDSDARAAMEAVLRFHPHAQVGYSPELERAFRANPTALKRGGPPARAATLADRLIARRGIVVLVGLLGAVSLVFAGVPVVRDMMKGPPIPKPTFENVALDAKGLRLTVHTVPGASVELLTGQTTVANEKGIASFDVALSELKTPEETRSMAVTVSKDGQYAGARVQFPRTLGEAVYVGR